MGEAQLEETWVSSIEDEGLRTELGKFESQDKLFDAIGYEAPTAGEPTDWREGLDEDLSKVAERFTSADDALRSIVAFQKREGQVRVPGKDATDDEIAAYSKAIGVPESASEYEFPELEEGHELTDEIKASREAWGERFLEIGLSKAAAKQVAAMYTDEVADEMESLVQADEEFVSAQEEALKNEWKGDEYEKNKNFANRAFSEIADRAGIALEDLTTMETVEGQLLMDDARMMKLFAVIGREMSEGSLGPTLTEGERDTAEDQLGDIRKQIVEATNTGDSKKANKLYQKEQSLIAKMDGDKPIVGAV